MTYVLLYVDNDMTPCFIQGSMTEINERLRTRWINGDIDKEEWEYRYNWQLLSLEDGVLTPVGNVKCNAVPYFEVI